MGNTFSVSEHPVSFIEPAEEDVVEAEAPEAIVGLLQADVLPLQSPAQAELLCLQACGLRA